MFYLIFHFHVNVRPKRITSDFYLWQKSCYNPEEAVELWKRMASVNNNAAQNAASFVNSSKPRETD